jgi:prevent-host-death family protein
METVDSYEAKTHPPRLLERVEHGETIIITRHGKAIARLVPAAPAVARPDVAEVIEAMRSFPEREGPTLGDDLSVRDLINERNRSSETRFDRSSF